MIPFDHPYQTCFACSVFHNWELDPQLDPRRRRTLTSMPRSPYAPAARRPSWAEAVAVAIIVGVILAVMACTQPVSSARITPHPRRHVVPATGLSVVSDTRCAPMRLPIHSLPEIEVSAACVRSALATRARSLEFDPIR
ncbi:hypothetical protein GCM10025782_11600 [Pedococcus ginsenosidimutans]|uniref:Uncharacterized protein n=1 Tax=Pedococcus ginsenosidimutans TaxID=490570 RepID=A0ABP8XXK7_9MICO